MVDGVNQTLQPLVVRMMASSVIARSSKQSMLIIRGRTGVNNADL